MQRSWPYRTDWLLPFWNWVLSVVRSTFQEFRCAWISFWRSCHTWCRVLSGIFTRICRPKTWRRLQSDGGLLLTVLMCFWAGTCPWSWWPWRKCLQSFCMKIKLLSSSPPSWPWGWVWCYVAQGNFWNL